MINQFGEHSFADGSLIVKVSEADGKLEIARNERGVNVVATNLPGEPLTLAKNLSFTMTLSPGDWKAHAGWFVFIENPSRIWAYDGDQLLNLDAKDSSGNSVLYGPETLPCPVPDTVLIRLPDSVKNRIKVHPH